MIELLDLYTWLSQTQCQGIRLQRFLGFATVNESTHPLVDFSQLCFGNMYDPATMKSHPLQNYRYVLEVADVRVLGTMGAVLTNDDTLLLTEQFFPETLQSYQFLLEQLNTRDLEYTRIPGRTAVVTAEFCDNYYHALMDLIPKLRLLEASGLSYDTLLINNSQPFQFELLQKLHLPCQRIIGLNGPGIPAYHLEHLIMPSYLDVSGYPSADKLNWICSLFPYPRRLNNRIYISRGQASRRRVLNEAALIELLERYGFQTVHMETLSVEEQFELTSQAAVVVAPIGAGVVNMLGAPEGCQLIELVPTSSEPRGLFPRIFEPRGIQCYQYLAEFEDGWIAPNLHVDFQVDLEDFEAFLNRVLNGEEVMGHYSNPA